MSRKNKAAELSPETLAEEYVISILRRSVRRQTGKIPSAEPDLGRHYRVGPLSIAIEFDQLKVTVTVSHRHDKYVGKIESKEMLPIKQLVCDLADPNSKSILEKLFNEDIRRFRRASWAELENMQREAATTNDR